MSHNISQMPKLQVKEAHAGCSSTTPIQYQDKLVKVYWPACIYTGYLKKIETRFKFFPVGDTWAVLIANVFKTG